MEKVNHLAGLMAEIARVRHLLQGYTDRGFHSSENFSPPLPSAAHLCPRLTHLCAQFGLSSFERNRHLQNLKPLSGKDFRVFSKIESQATWTRIEVFRTQSTKILLKVVATNFP